MLKKYKIIGENIYANIIKERRIKSDINKEITKTVRLII